MHSPSPKHHSEQLPTYGDIPPATPLQRGFHLGCHVNGNVSFDLFDHRSQSVSGRRPHAFEHGECAAPKVLKLYPRLDSLFSVIYHAMPHFMPLFGGRNQRAPQ